MATFSWFKERAGHTTSAGSFVRAFTEEGIELARSAERLSSDAIGSKWLNAVDVDDLLAQLDDEGMTTAGDGTVLIPWTQVYQLIENPEYRGAEELLELPATAKCVPSLESYNSLTDRNFSIVVAEWYDPAGLKLHRLDVCGAIAKDANGLSFLSHAAWQTISQVSQFQKRSEADRNDSSQRRLWSQIRGSAMSAGARLDGFLFRNVILTPEKLKIGLRSNDVGGTRMVEIIPSFPGAPSNWIEIFDGRREIPDRYDIPSADGIVQVLISSNVKTVLESIKAMPGRRVAGARAEAFLINPFAALGEAATATIDEDQFLEAREQANLLFEHFAAHIRRDALGFPEEVGLRIEILTQQGRADTEVRIFVDDQELEEFVKVVGSALTGGRQLCAWQGYDFELLGETTRELDLLNQALKARREPRILVSYATIYDLSIYSSRVEDIGTEKNFYSPFIAKKNDEDGWFPENLVPVIAWTPEGETEPVAVPITEQAREQLQAKIKEAKETGQTSFELKGFEKPVPVREAEFILRTFSDAYEDAQNQQFDPARPRNSAAPRAKKHLVIKANIQSIDYEETRRDILRTIPDAPTLPAALRTSVVLKDHQILGVAWLQHLFSNAPNYCRGAVLADDMGLGKTLQLLTLLAWAFEEDPALPPALIVAPVSLLENWEEEARKFLVPGSLPMLTAYGESLGPLRVPRDSIDNQLRVEGLVRFLKAGWRGNARAVLTTYETLRDMEFSFAAEKWSIMICDEAQRVKNPNAMVTRAAKKQNVRFKIACTGTPVENTLADLWCLFDYVQPGLLGALNDFGRRYRRPIEAETEEERARVSELREKIAPQILRRTKLEVAKDLPPKKVVPSVMHLSGHQRALYAHALERYKRRNDAEGIIPFKNHLGLLHYLRLICTDPRRIGLNVFRPEPLDDYRLRAPKLAWLLSILFEIQSNGEKVIIFCEFREMQRMLRHYIEEVFGFAPDIINGDTSAAAAHIASRQKRIRAFQARPGFGAIILSPIAVGFGVNIQAANHVIHYTRTWNPAKEDQATDRAYRIGQTKEVSVYCPIVYADDFTTFDVKLDQLLTAKRQLAGDMLNGSGDVGPGEFAVEDVIPGANDPAFSSSVTLNDALEMRWEYFEALVAAIWQKKGYARVYRTPAKDDGVDVVAITGASGVLLQCKSSGADEASLGWDAVKEVVGGEAAYCLRHPGVAFKKICITNRFFNSTAETHADLNGVELLDQGHLGKILVETPVSMLDVEKLIYAEWR
jgi:SNF2-related domain/Restriction endonuclease/Helicase conserved C-terminal domain